MFNPSKKKQQKYNTIQFPYKEAEKAGATLPQKNQPLLPRLGPQ